MSGRKNILPPFVDPKMTAQSMAASISGTPTNIQYLDNVGIQLHWSGNNPIGTIGVQVSNDYNPNTLAGTWTPLQTTPGTNLTVSPGGTAGTAYLNLDELAAPWVQVTYTTASGSVGVITSVITAKMV
jgi:hypothetical protein